MTARTFREHRLVSLEMKLMSVQGQAYRDYPIDQKHFTADQIFPSHHDFPLHMVRLILLGTPHGDTAVIDAARMSKAMRDNLIRFLKDPKTVVCGFDFQSQAWAFHLTFGDNPILFPVFDKLSKTQKDAYRDAGILADLRVFDLSNVLQCSLLNKDGYNFREWEKIGLIPEGFSLWHLGQAAMCIDLVGNDTSSLPHLDQYWNVHQLDTARLKYIQVDIQTCIVTFMVLLRYGLISDAKQIINVFPHDYRSPDDIYGQLSMFSCVNDDHKALDKFMFQEMEAQVDHRDGISSRFIQGLRFCVAHVVNTSSQIQTKAYDPRILPAYKDPRKNKDEYDDSNQTTSILQRKAESSVKQISSDVRYLYGFDPKDCCKVGHVAGGLPFFIAATSPRCRKEANEYLGDVVKLCRSMYGNRGSENLLKEVCKLN